MSSTLDNIKMKMLLNPKLTWYCAVLYGLNVTLEEIPSNTAMTNGIDIKISPNFWDQISDDEKVGLILHELRHITDLHWTRQGTRDTTVWNIAGDFVINNDITSEGFKIPEGGLVNPEYKDMSVEEIYELLIEDMDNLPKLPMNDIGEPDEASGEETGSIHDQIKDLVIQATQQAQMQESKTGQGNIPMHIQRMVNEWLNPVLPWDTLLRRYMSAKSKEDFSWQRPSRRYLPHNLYMPSMYSESLGPINIYIDGSGSVSDEMFALQVGQFNWIHANLRPSELKIIVFDVVICDEFTFRPHEPVNITFNAGGGTCVIPVIEHMKNNPAECHLIFTDGHFTQLSLDEIKEDVICCIYDNDSFTWEGAETIYIPRS